MGHSIPEAKLRASCDRCHELKNRCARAGGADSRCERCERLDIDCVYSRAARTGRPLTHKSDTGNKSESHPRPSKRQNHGQAGRHSPVNADFGTQKPDDTLDGHYNGITPSPQNVPELALPDRAQNISPLYFCPQLWQDDIGSDEIESSSTENPQHHFEWLIAEVKPPEATPPTDSVDGNPPALTYTDIDNPPPVGLQKPNLPVSVNYVGPGTGSKVGTFDGLETTADKLLYQQDRLLKIQNQLGNLTSASQTGVFDYVPNDEALAMTKDLLDITYEFLQLGSPRSARLMTGQKKPKDSAQRFSYLVLKSPSTPSWHVTILQMLTCYAYLLQILESLVSRLSIQLEMPQAARLEFAHSKFSPGTPSLTARYNNGRRSSTFPQSPTLPLPNTPPTYSIGRFSFSSQPTLNDELLLRAIIHMINEMHINISLLTIGEGEMSQAMEQQHLPAAVTTNSGEGTASFCDSAASSPVVMSAQAIMTVVHMKKRALAQKISSLTSS